MGTYPYKHNRSVIVVDILHTDIDNPIEFILSQVHDVHSAILRNDFARNPSSMKFYLEAR